MTTRKYAVIVLLFVCHWLIFSSIAVSADDNPPSITLISEIPAETTDETLLLEGVVTDDHGLGIASVRVMRAGKSPFIRTLEKIEETQKSFTFRQSVPLEVGENTIKLQVVDSDHQAVIEVK
jgi:hypothetical protein